MKICILLFTTALLIGHSNCFSQSFSQISKQLEQKCSKKIPKKSKDLTFHKLRVKLYESGKLDFINYSDDTLFILETYDIQDGSFTGRLWNRNGFILYEYYFKRGFTFTGTERFTNHTIKLIQKWDLVSILQEEKLYSDWNPIHYINSSRIIFFKQPKIDCLRFREFFNAQRDSG